MRILFINSSGSGFAAHKEIPDGWTVQKLFHEEIGEGKENNYVIRVNSAPATASRVLQEGDRVSFTMSKIEGAN